MSEEQVEKEMNPLYLEHITLEDCPECEGTGRGMLTIHNRDGTGTKVPMIHDLPDTDMNCKNCTDGKVETLTQKVLFNPKEYDKDIWETGHDVGLETGIKLHEEELKENNASK